MKIDLSRCGKGGTSGGHSRFWPYTSTATGSRALPLTASMREHLGSVREHQEATKRPFGRDYTGSGHICVKPDGTPIDPDLVTHHFRRVLVANDVPIIRFHDLRDTHYRLNFSARKRMRSSRNLAVSGASMMEMTEPGSVTSCV